MEETSIYTLEEITEFNREAIKLNLWNEGKMKKYSNVYWGISYQQALEIAKDLMIIYYKLDLDIEKLTSTIYKLSELSDLYKSDSKSSINYYISNNNIGLTTGYNESTMNILKRLGEYDKLNKGYIIPVALIEQVFNELEMVDADCINAKNDLFILLPELKKKIENEEIALLEQKEEAARIEEEERRTAITFVGKSQTNNFGYFQYAQKYFADYENSIMEIKKAKKKEAKKQAIKEKFEKFTLLFKNK